LQDYFYKFINLEMKKKREIDIFKIFKVNGSYLKTKKNMLFSLILFSVPTKSI